MQIEINVPDGKSGEWEVKSFEVSKEDAAMTLLRASFGHRRDYVPEGKYKYLKRNGSTIMSNTPTEISDFMGFVRRATGNVLVNGLGLGVLLKALLNKPDVTKITVIEKSADVIKLVAKTYLQDSRVTIINADAFEYVPPKNQKYDAVWHDIWDDICWDNLSEMTKLHKKYGRRSQYQESWCRAECKRG